MTLFAQNKGVKYDITTTERCPLCKEDIQVGTAGPQGLAQHQGKKKCLATVKKKRQDTEMAKKPTLFLIRVREPGCEPRAGGVTLNLAPNDQTNRALHETNNMQQPQATPARKGCRTAWLLLDRLQAEIVKFPPEVLEGGGDELWTDLSGYNRNSALSVCADVPQDELWENVNPGLDRILGFGRPHEEIAAMVRCSWAGLQGLYEYLEVLVEEGGVVGGLLEGKVTALIAVLHLLRTIMDVSSPIPLPIPASVAGTRELPIEVLEDNDKSIIRARSISSRKRSMRATEPMTKPCSGAYLAMPDGVLPYSAYPFMLHEAYTLPWNIHIVGHRMFVQSIQCGGVQETSSDSCRACSQLLTHRIVEGILARIKNGIHENTTYVYQPIGGLIEVLRKKCALLDELRFKQLSISRSLATRARTVGQYEQLVMAMSEGSVNHLDALLRAGLNRGLGVRGMVELLDRARKGLYKPKNFTEEEMSRGLLFLRLGGARVARLAHQTLGAPSVSTLHHRSNAISLQASLSPCAGFPTKSEIQCNIRVAFQNLRGNTGCGYVLMIDEIKVEERMRWDPSTNRILGLCQEHTEHVGLEFCSMSDARALVHGVLVGEIHHASEATVFSIGILSEDRHTWGSRPFIVIGTCKREGCDRHARLISTVIEACNAESSVIGCPLFSIASDGESHRGSALTKLTHVRPLGPDSELHVLLGNLCLMNLLVGNNDITADKDPKHVMKRCRNFSIRKSGVMINGFVITPALLRFHLQANKMPPHRISYLLNPTDRQDVPLCYTFMKEIWTLPPPAPTDKPGFVAAREALLILGSLFRHLVLPFVQVSLTLHEQLVHLSAAAHLATYLFTVKGARNKAMPSLTFKDLILLVKNAYFCVAKAKIYTPDGNFYLVLNGTDRLESTFGVVRSMVGNDANADVLTLGYRLSHAVECLNILSEHPMWDRGPRRPHLRGIKDGNGDVISKSDHITPASWDGNVNVRNVSLVTAWNLGRRMVTSKFPSNKIEELLLELENKGYDMEFPFGQVTESIEMSDDDDDGDDEQDERNGEGPLLDLEDHASIETSRDGQGEFSPLIDIGNGKEVPKARILRELERATFSKVPGSTDRLNRCAGLSRYAKTSPLLDLSGDVIDSTSKGVLSIGDPAATIVNCEGQFFLAIIQINEILFDTSPVLEISPRFLMEPTVTVQFQIYQVVETSNDDPDVDSADWKWNRKLEHPVLKTKGAFIQVISPAIAIPEVNTPIYFFRTDKLRAIAACLFSSVPVHDRGRLLRLLKRSSHFPYRTNSAHAAFVCETDLDERPITGHTCAQPNCCPVCQLTVPWDLSKPHKILEHVATHILFDSTLDTATELCGLCMRPSSLCVFYLRKGKGAGSAPQIDECVSCCPNLTGRLSYSTAATERTNSPCTNVPVICSLCPSTSTAVWKYNMKTHLARIHPSTKGSDSHKAYMISESEKAALKILWERRYKISRRHQRHNAVSTPLAISEAHTSRQAFFSRTSHRLDEDSASEQGGRNSDAYMEDEREPESASDHWIPDATAEVDLSPVDTVATHLGPQLLVSVNQTEFTLEGWPTRHGRIRRTRDMMEVTACICGKPVESESKNADTAVQCGYRGCETLWVSVFYLPC
ncbi:hypothetical protein H4582DRAFT_1821850 [Lactarius indigo]|nr:hypothetical protein H4582DRAFT_1821850 [Lactarius indigo]